VACPGEAIQLNIRTIVALATMIGITLGSLLVWETEAGAPKSFSGYDIAQATITAEEDSYQSPRKKRKLVKSSDPTKAKQSKPQSIFDLFNENETVAAVKSKKRLNSRAATAPIKNRLSRGAARRAEEARTAERLDL
jgi:hypothetical protein